MPDVDLEEIFSHVEQLKSEKEKIHEMNRKGKIKEKKKDNKSESINDDKKSKMECSKAVDLNNKIIKKLDDLSNENISTLFKKESETNVKSSVLFTDLKDKLHISEAANKSEENMVQQNKNNLDLSQLSHFNLNDDSSVTCDICKNDMILGKNLSGLVVEDQFFACENCCQSSTKNILTDWTKNRMESPYGVRPIGIWLTQKKSENKSILFRK